MDTALSPLCFCIVCRRLNRPRPARWCEGCGSDLIRQETLLYEGLFALLDAYAPPHLSGAVYGRTLQGEELVRLYSEVYYLWESGGTPGMCPPGLPSCPIYLPRQVYASLAALGLIDGDVCPTQLHWAYRVLSKDLNPDCGGDPTGKRMQQLNQAYAAVSVWAGTRPVAS